MGSWFQKPKDYSQNLLVATLNYGGIINGPFQFFSVLELQGLEGAGSENSQNTAKEQKKISDTFHELMPLYQEFIGKFKHNDAKSFKWEIGKIDQNFQIQRYTPVYRPNAGIENGKFVTQDKFIQKWKQCVSKEWPQKDQDQIKNEHYEDQKKVMMGFDLIAYHTFLRILYHDKIQNDKPLSYQGSILEHLSVRKYQLFMQQYFSRDYLNEEKKIKRLIYALSKNFHNDLLDQDENMPGTKLIDVLFLQEPTDTLIAAIKNIRDKNGQSVFFVSGEKKLVVIVVRRQRFITEVNKKNKMSDEQIFIEMKKMKNLKGEQYEHLKQKFKYETWPFALKTLKQQQMSFEEKCNKIKDPKQKQKQVMKHVKQNPDLNKELFAIPETNILVCQNFIFIGLHLSSKKKPNKIQCEILKKQLKYLNRFQNEYEIIAAGDINSYLNNEGIENYKIYPADQKYLTTNKKRTYMQAQYDKANKTVTECKDHIIANANMVKSGVMTIQIDCATKQFLLPTSKHPFDHFMVVTLINKRLKEKTKQEIQAEVKREDEQKLEKEREIVKAKQMENKTEDEKEKIIKEIKKKHEERKREKAEQYINYHAPIRIVDK